MTEQGFVCDASGASGKVASLGGDGHPPAEVITTVAMKVTVVQRGAA